MLSHIGNDIHDIKSLRTKVGKVYADLKVRERHEIVDDYREAFILTGYRANYSFFEVLCSLFKRTNETVNFWTHIIPSLFFLYKFHVLSQVYDVFYDPYILPLSCYMFSIVLYPGVSAVAHAFSCMSPLANHICFLLDYSTLSFYSWGAGILYAAYSMPKDFYDSWYNSIFLPVSAILAVMATLCACFSRFFDHHKVRKFLRLIAFSIPFIWDSIPLLMRLYSNNTEEDPALVLSFRYHSTQFISVTLASLFYATHIPELFKPGSFDFLGHSHNLMHVFATFASYQQMQAALIDLDLRRDEFIEKGWTVDPLWSQSVTALIMGLNFLIIITFTVLLSTKEGRSKPFCRQDHLKQTLLDDSNSKKDS